MDACQGETFSQEPKKQEQKAQKNEQLTLLDWQSGKNLKKTRKPFRPIERVWEEAGQDMALVFSMVLEQFFSYFRICIVCRSKLQEWKQISRQDDFKQTVQDMRVSTLSTPSTLILPSL